MVAFVLNGGTFDIHWYEKNMQVGTERVVENILNLFYKMMTYSCKTHVIKIAKKTCAFSISRNGSYRHRKKSPHAKVE